MKRIFPLLLLSALAVQGCTSSKSASKDKTATPLASRAGTVGDRNQQYAGQYGSAAILEMERDGIPASIILAQGILESGAGSSELATNANNHFGIKCGSGWSGKSYKKQDDDKDEEGNLIESCFRKYNKVEDSFHDHGEFLRDPRKDHRYGFLFQLDRTDYKAWAEGLESAGYSTSNTYAEKLIDIIERYKLYEYDTPGTNSNSGMIPNPENPNAGGTTGANIPLPNPANRIGRINDTKVVLSREGETVSDIAKSYRLNVDKVANYNDRGYTPAQKLKSKTRIFIQQKKDKWNGRATEHFVKDNETMFDISQLYGVKLEKLLQRNRLSQGQEPAIGERIRLKGKRPAGESLRLRDVNTDPTVNTPGQPQPTPPTNEIMIPDDNDPIIADPSGNEKPNTGQPGNDMKPPAVTGTPYPADPIPNQPNQPDIKPQPNQPGTPQPVAPNGYHIVVKGDTLYSISRKYNTTVARIKQWNNLTDDTVKIGQTIRVK
ncbi:MAG: LysM peptidoglycan-binding domain-containing protein [Saprospiraceae bacterium]|nr:LysM peptidoglycan-binding domain-containing protein [Saprospiraceae bacterium]